MPGSLLFNPLTALPPVLVRTGLYGTYALERYTRWDDDAGATRLYFVGSFLQRDHDKNPPPAEAPWQDADHGQVHLFAADLRCVQ